MTARKTSKKSSGHRRSTPKDKEVKPMPVNNETTQDSSPDPELQKQGPFEGPDALLDFAEALAESGQSSEAHEAESESFLQTVTFILDEEEFGLPIQQVREIVRVSEITRVPHAPEHVQGVTNLRGRIIPVVDLKTRIGLKSVKLTKDSRVLVVEGRDRPIGLLVDSVSQVTRIAVSTIEATPQEVQSVQADYIRGVAKLGDRLIILLDVKRILVLNN